MPLQRAELHAAGWKVGGRLRIDGLERTQSDPDAIQVGRDFPLLRKGRRFVGTAQNVNREPVNLQRLFAINE